MERNFSIDPGRLGRYRAAADAARGASRAGRNRENELRRQLSEAEAELSRMQRARPGVPSRGVTHVDTDGRRRGRIKSDHESYAAGARQRAEAVRAELRQASSDNAEGAAARAHAVELFGRLEAYVREAGR